ncbi:MAG: alpha/beta hydrolase [Mariniblastus sp.]|nr:alpha/beta hydrolase [Mariniblastus sp.]
MPLDPQVQTFLAEFADSEAKPFHEMTPAEARRVTREFRALAGTPEEVHAVQYDFIPGPTADLPVRIYHPSPDKAKSSLPGLIYFHGGGWVLNNTASADNVSRAICNVTGCVVMTVNYQKAPEHKYPVPFDDCYAATEWVFENAAALGMDADRIGLIGDSSGGNLAAAVALKARDTNGPKLACQVLVYPVTQYGWDTPSYQANAEGYLLDRPLMQYFWRHYAPDPVDGLDPYFAPLAAEDHSGLPPALVVVAEYDPLCDEGTQYSDRLSAAGVPVKRSLYRGMIHGFLSMAGVFDQTQNLFNEIGREVRSMMGTTPPPASGAAAKESPGTS